MTAYSSNACLCVPLQPTWRFQDLLGTNPTWNCTIAASTDTYDYYTGTSNFLRCGAGYRSNSFRGCMVTDSRCIYACLPADALA